MNPDNQNPETQNQQPLTSSTGSDWQKQAVADVRAGPQPPTKQAQGYTGVPDWQQSLQPQQAAPAAPQQPEVPDMLAAVDPPQRPAAPQPPQPPTSTPLPDISSAGPQVVSGSFGEDVPGIPVTGTGAPSLKGKVWVIVVLVGVLLALGVAAYFLFMSGKQKTVKEATQESQQSASVSAKDISTLDNLTFNKPDLTGYHVNEAQSTATFTTQMTEDEKCAVSFGTVSAEQLPGATYEELVDAQIKLLRDAGANIEGPTASEALVLKDAADSKVTYKMPTLAFKISKEKVRGSTRYSVAILKNGQRAVVTRVCANENAEAIPDGLLTPLEKKAQELTVNANPAATIVP